MLGNIPYMEHLGLISYESKFTNTSYTNASCYGYSPLSNWDIHPNMQRAPTLKSTNTFCKHIFLMPFFKVVACKSSIFFRKRILESSICGAVVFVFVKESLVSSICATQFGPSKWGTYPLHIVTFLIASLTECCKCDWKVLKDPAVSWGRKSGDSCIFVKTVIPRKKLSKKKHNTASSLELMNKLHNFAMWVCLKIWYIPNEIAIFHRDNDQQNHWVNGV